MKDMQKIFFLFLFLPIVLACQVDSKPQEIVESQTIVIQDNMFLPTSITVDPGQTVFFYNEDFVPHQILSQSAPDQFDDTGEFESLVLTEGDIRDVVIPEDAVSGTELYFYDNYLQDQMITPNGTFIVN